MNGSFAKWMGAVLVILVATGVVGTWSTSMSVARLEVQMQFVVQSVAQNTDRIDGLEGGNR